jgi:PAS domain S-box-containing protein
MDLLESLFARGGLLPHSVCLSASPGLLWTMVGADVVIASAYFSIPLAIASFVRQRDMTPNRWMVALFSAFIFACGTTHVMGVWTVWRPDYALLVFSKLLTAGLSLVTAALLWPLIPRALKIPSVSELQVAVNSLRAEVGRRKTAEQHLAEIEQNLAVTLASIEAGFIATDAEGHVTRMNAVAEQVTGWTQSAARGQHLWAVFARENRPAALGQRNPLDLLLEAGITVDQPQLVTVIARSGQCTPLEVRAALTRADDNTVRGLALVFRDMTRINRAEFERHRLAAIVESSFDAILGKTLDGRITSWNAAATAMFGYSVEQAVGASVQMLIPPEHKAEEAHLLADLAQGRHVVPFDSVRLTRDGRRLTVSITISPIHDASGHIVGASKTLRDITDQQLARQARLKADRLEAENRQILAATRLKSQFLANMSHELRTPLNAIIGFAELLHADKVPTNSPKHRQFLAHIGSSGHHLLRLINDLLDLSKVESGKFVFYPEPVDLGPLVSDVFEVLDDLAMRKQQRLVVDIDPALTDLVLDPARFKQVLYNYLSNAIKFTPEQGLVTLRARAAGPQAFRLEVEDTGIGIAAADLARLFVEFQQLDDSYSKQHQGTGLGLALTRRLVQAQGGSVGVRSTPGVGSVFHLEMPRAPAATAETASLVPAAAGNPRRLLVIQHDPALQAQLRQGLQAAGFDIDLATSGQQAVAQARERAYDAITLDLQLPDLPGLSALAGIRAEGASRASPVLALTLPVAARQSVSFAIADLLGKPIRSAEVVSAMAALRPPPGRRTRVMVVDDDPIALDLMATTLRGLAIDVVCVNGGQQALREIDQHRPDAVILDLMMPGFDGFATLDALRQRTPWQHLPVFIWSSMVLTDEEVATLTRSAEAIISKGGGALAQVLDGLRQGQPPPPPPQLAPAEDGQAT